MTKCIVFVANRLWLIIAIYLISLTLSSFLFAYTEGKSVGNGLWWSISTSLSIGYGDQVPVTSSGRIAAAIFAHFWIFAILPLIASNIIIRVIEDKHRFTDDEQLVLFDRIERIEKLLAVAVESNNRSNRKE